MNQSITALLTYYTIQHWMCVRASPLLILYYTTVDVCVFVTPVGVLYTTVDFLPSVRHHDLCGGTTDIIIL